MHVERLSNPTEIFSNVCVDMILLSSKFQRWNRPLRNGEQYHYFELILDCIESTGRKDQRTLEKDAILR